MELDGLMVRAGGKGGARFHPVCMKDVQYESLESLCHLKHVASRRESPWKLEGEALRVSSKLKLLEQELLNLERIGKSDLSKVSSKTRKQTRRYQALAAKIDNLCRRMTLNFLKHTIRHRHKIHRHGTPRASTRSSPSLWLEREIDGP